MQGLQGIRKHDVGMGGSDAGDMELGCGSER